MANTVLQAVSEPLSALASALPLPTSAKQYVDGRVGSSIATSNTYANARAASVHLRKLSGAKSLANQGLSTAGAAGKTFASLHQIPANSMGVQFEFANILTGGPITYNSSYAVSAGINDWFTPLNASGTPDDTLWIPVTSSGSASITVAAAPTANQPSRAVSDVMPFLVPPPARVDGGSGICIFFRQYSASAGTYRVFDGSVGNWTTFANGANPGQFSETFGGGWADPANYTGAGVGHGFAGGALFNCAVPHAVIPVLSGPALSIMSVGDSILSGVASLSTVDRGINGVGWQLKGLLDSAARPAFHINEALSGETSGDFLANGTVSLPLYKPDVIILQAYSANDTNAATTAVAWTAFQKAMQFAALAAASGTRVIILTSPPFAGAGSPRPASTWEATRTYANSLVRASGLPYVDCDAAVGTGTGPVSYVGGMSTDLIHPNATGSAALASACAAVLLSAYGII